MTKKEWLRRGRWLRVRLNGKLERIQWLRDLAGKATGSVSAFRFGGTSERSKVERYICEMIDCENRLKADISRLCLLLREIQDAIDAVENEQYRTLLELRYVDCKDWDEIADIMGYGERQVMRIHGSALQAIQKDVIECQ